MDCSYLQKKKAADDDNRSIVHLVFAFCFLRVPKPGSDLKVQAANRGLAARGTQAPENRTNENRETLSPAEKENGGRVSGLRRFSDFLMCLAK
jgi:hypothetical protein